MTGGWKKITSKTGETGEIYDYYLQLKCQFLVILSVFLALPPAGREATDYRAPREDRLYVLNLMMRRREGIGQRGGGSGGRGGGEGGWRTWIGADRSFRERVQARRDIAH